MEEDKKLYPMQFCTLRDEYNWGYEEFKLADLGYRDSLVREGWLMGNSISEIMDMYLDRVVGDNVFEYYGRQFPLSVKNIQVNGSLPLQVCPDDSFAFERYDFLGKDKVWYVVSCGSNAAIKLGFKNDTDAGRVYESCLDGSIDKILNTVAPYPGQVLRIAPGTPHAALGEISIVEVSESSPLDFCMFGWGQEVSEEQFDPALSLVDALEFIDYRAFKASDSPLAFKSRKLDLKDPLHVYSQTEGNFSLYTCLKGSADIRIEVFGQNVDYRLNAMETLLLPSECYDYYLLPLEQGTCLVESSVDRDDKDPYINPDVASTLPGEEE